MGSVYRVLDQALDREVALKVLTVPGDARSVERLRAEARILAGLEHPGIVPVHDAGMLADGRPYYAMKLVRGVRLDAFAKTNPGRTALLRVFESLCDAVAFAHERGVWHRDLKPANVMVGDFGEVLVLDWGVGEVGTPGFMAPEQATGEGVDQRTDVHGLGRILETLLPTDAGRPILAIARKAATPDPLGRYASVRELRQEVARFRDGEAISAYAESLLERGERIVRRNPTLFALIATYAVVRTLLLLRFP
jgi:serine/threonine protein kinase